MDYRRVAEIYDSQRGSGGTGYLIRPTLILTAHHVVAPLGQPGIMGTTYDVRLIGDYEAGRTEWLKNSCQLCWDAPDEKVDLALLKLDSQFISENVSDDPIKFGRMVVDEIFANGYGFPAVQVIENRQNPDYLKGFLNRVTGIKEGQLRLQVKSLIPDQPSAWEGISGTALFFEDFLVGVVVETDKGFAEKALWAVPISIAIDAQKFCNLVFGDNPDCIELLDVPAPTPPRRIPFMVEDLPKNFVQRAKEFNALIEQLLDVEREEPLAITTSIRGAGGYGKTTLAMALCHDESVQDAYDDGILWITLGEKPGDLTEKIKNLIEKLSGKRPGYTDENSAAAHLSELLADRGILIVIDDVWKSEDVQPFLRGGPRCSRLITTRNSDTLPTKCRQNILDAMQPDEALSLIRYELPPSDKEKLQDLSQWLGKWPLVLKMVNAVLIERVVNQGQPLKSAIAHVFKRLQKHSITAFDARNSKSRSHAVEVTIGVSLELLNQEEKDRFHELAIFPEDTLIPLETVEKLWMHAGLDDLDTEDLCERLFQFSLLLYFDPRTRMIRLHDVIRSYLRKKNERQLPIMHVNFLNSYCVDQWADLPTTEPYLWNNLAYHLVDSGESNRLKNLLFDYSWLKGKLVVSDVNVLLSDYDYFPDDKELSLVQQALRLSSNQLTHDPDQLSPQLIGRLKDISTPEIIKLLGDATESRKGPWFKPISCSLTPPGGPLLQTFEGHSDWVKAVTISQDGKIALSGSFDHTLMVWDLVGVKALHTLEGHSSTVTSVAISQDGKIGLSGSSDHTLKLWDIASGKGLSTLEGHSYWVTSVAISPDGKTAVSGSSDHTLKLWDIASGKALHTLEGHSDGVTSVAISPDGKAAVSGSSDYTLKLWDLASGKVVRTLETHSSEVTAVAISQDGKIAVSGSGDKTIKVWDLICGKALHTLEGHSYWVTAVAISQDGKIAVSGSGDKTIKVWDLVSGKVLHTLEGHSDRVTTVAINPDGKTAVSGSEDQTLKLWDLRSSKALHTLEGHSSAVTAMAISPDGKTAVSGLYDCTLRVWDLRSRKTLHTLEGHSDGVTAVAINPDGNTALSGSGDKTLIEWDLVSGKALRILEGHSDWVTEVTISPDGRTAVSGSYDCNLMVWDLVSGKVLHTLVAHSRGVTAAAISPDGKTAVSGSEDQTLKLWDLGSGRAFHTLEGHSSAVTAVATSPDGKTAISGSYDCTVMVWDLVSGQALHTLEGHSRGVTAVAINPDGKTAVSGSSDRTLKLWDLGSGKVLASFIGESNINVWLFLLVEES